MNIKSLKNWEVRLGTMHVAILLGLITGSMACAFYFGFYTGQDTGYERAYAANMNQAVRLPITVDNLPEQIADESVTEVYARLNDDVARLPQIEEGVPFNANLDSGGHLQVDSVEPAEQSVPPPAAIAAPEKPVAKVAKVNEQVQKEPVKELSKAAVSKVIEKPAATNGNKTAALNNSSKPVQITTNVPKGWFAQVAAPKAKADAEQLARTLRGSGFPVVIENANVRGQQYFRVLVGPEGSRDQGERLIAQLKREGSVKGDPFLRSVK